MTQDETINMEREAGSVVTTTIEELEQEIYENTRRFVPTDVMQWMLSRYYTTTKKHQDDIISLAREADPFGERGRLFDMAQLTPETLVRFAALVAAAEREECAKVCDSVVIEHPGRADLTAGQCAAAIRARGNV